MDRGYDEVLYAIEDQSIIRAINLEGNDLLFKVSEKGKNLKIEILYGEVSPATIMILKSYVVDWFDLKRDLRPFYKLLQSDPRVSILAEQYCGLHLVGIPDLFEALCWCIIGQQINLTFAYRIKRRLVTRYGRQLQYEGQKYYLFPSSIVLAEASEEDLKSMQFSRQKIRYLTQISQDFSDRNISQDQLAKLDSHDARRKRLLTITGIGIWTANYVLMKTFRDPNSVPYGDSGLYNALIELSIISNRSESRKLELFFDDFPGWKSYIAFYLWRSLY